MEIKQAINNIQSAFNTIEQELRNVKKNNEYLTKQNSTFKAIENELIDVKKHNQYLTKQNKELNVKLKNKKAEFETIKEAFVKFLIDNSQAKGVREFCKLYNIDRGYLYSIDSYPKISKKHNVVSITDEELLSVIDEHKGFGITEFCEKFNIGTKRFYKIFNTENRAIIAKHLQNTKKINKDMPKVVDKEKYAHVIDEVKNHEGIGIKAFCEKFNISRHIFYKILSNEDAKFIISRVNRKIIENEERYYVFEQIDIITEERFYVGFASCEKEEISSLYTHVAYTNKHAYKTNVLTPLLTLEEAIIEICKIIDEKCLNYKIFTTKYEDLYNRYRNEQLTC